MASATVACSKVRDVLGWGCVVVMPESSPCSSNPPSSLALKSGAAKYGSGSAPGLGRAQVE